MQSNPIEHAQVKSTDGAARYLASRQGTRVSVKSVSKSYAGRNILNAVHLDIEPGQFVAVVGRSGCGKSTLLRLIAGLEQADLGRIGFESREDKPQTRIMFQDSRLLPWKRVLDNVALGLNAASGAAGAALRQVGLEDRAGDWPAVLSGGQRQRVALARALVHDPELLLLDEPLGALDALTRIEMQQLIESLWQSRGFTALLVTHDVQEAIALADRVVLVEDGAIALDEKIDLPRPRARGSVGFARLEAHILSRVLKHPAVKPDTPLGDISFLKSAGQVAWAI